MASQKERAPVAVTGSVVQPLVSEDLLSYDAIGSNYLSFVVTSLLASTTPLAEAGTATTVYREK